MKALHRAGIEVILDVVYNHTAEGDHDGPDAVLPRPRQRDVLPPPARPRALRGLHRHRQHAERERGGGAPPDRRQPAVLGRPHARRRLPVRPGLGAVARRVGLPAPASSRPVGHRVGSGPGRDQADRRGLGRRRALPGRQLRRRRLAGVEREVPRRRPSVREVRQRYRARLRLPLLRQPGSLRARGAGAGAEHQLRHVARRVHAERPRQLQRQAQRGERAGRP